MLIWFVMAIIIMLVFFTLLTVYRLWSEAIQVRKFVAECVMEEELKRLISMLAPKSSCEKND